MIRKLLATTAVATLLATGSYAQEATQPATDQGAAVHMSGSLASSLIGESVYNGTGNDAANIGDVNDLVIGPDGKVSSVVIGVGGFLGIAEKNVALNFSDIKWSEKDGDRWIVLNASKEQLEAMPAFDRNTFGVASTASDTDTTAATRGKTDTMTTGAIDRSQLKEVPTGDIRAENLVGTTVYGAEDANVGEIGDVVLTQDGKIDAVIIDVGGFLGIGEKEVAVGMDNLAFMTDANGNKYLYTNVTKDQLNAAPAYDKSTWAEKRDEQRLVITR